MDETLENKNTKDAEEENSFEESSFDKKVLGKYGTVIEDTSLSLSMGRVRQVSGLSILTEGPGDASIGDLVRVETKQGDNHSIYCEIVGFQEHHLVLMPLALPTGVFPNALVSSSREKLSIAATEDLLGRVLDGLGRPIDQKKPLFSRQRLRVDGNPPTLTQRRSINKIMETGVRSIDGLNTIGRGQRIGIFAGAGVGKSTLLGMIARYTKADINVVCLVGERGREVGDFLENDLGKEGLERSVVFVATSDRSAMEKVYAAGFSTSVAEYFRDRGYHVNLYLDSITRYVMALREIGIASGEQLGPSGFPPRVWYQLSRLLERAGNIENGSITGFYTILVEGDDMNDPVADNSRGILDGHLILSRRLAQYGHYPSIEVVDSISRVMARVVSPKHLGDAQKLRSLLAAYRENEELIRLGAYAKGSNAIVDEAIDKWPLINAYLNQRIDEKSEWEDTTKKLEKILENQELIMM